MIFSSTGCGKQFDIFGTLFAIYLNILDKGKEEKTLKIIFDGYKNFTCVDENGYVRHIPNYNDFDENTMWEKSLCEKGTYQNGGYWAFFTGYYIYALSKIDKEESRKLFENFINHILKKGIKVHHMNGKIQKQVNLVDVFMEQVFHYPGK